MHRLQTMYYADWNDDACTDLVFISYVSASGCEGQMAGAGPADRVFGTADWDGDGRTDLLLSGVSDSFLKFNYPRVRP